MKFIILLMVFAFGQLFAGGPSRFFEMSSQQIDSLLTETAEKQLTVTQRMKIFSSYFLETPYDFKCVGDGPYALLETYPLVNFQDHTYEH